MDDLVIRGGMVLAAITPRYSGPARQMIEADGLIVAPGALPAGHRDGHRERHRRRRRGPAGVA